MAQWTKTSSGGSLKIASSRGSDLSLLVILGHCLTPSAVQIRLMATGTLHRKGVWHFITPEVGTWIMKLETFIHLISSSSKIHSFGSDVS